MLLPHGGLTANPMGAVTSTRFQIRTERRGPENCRTYFRPCDWVGTESGPELGLPESSTASIPVVASPCTHEGLDRVSGKMNWAAQTRKLILKTGGLLSWVFSMLTLGCGQWMLN
jgi:hypothetical protein